MSQLPSSIQHVVCYLRKSREDEEAERRGEDTLAKQRILMEQDVLSRYDFSYDLAEEVASGDSIRVRPVFQSLLPQLGTDYQAIVCKDLSRLGRGSYGDMGVVYDVIRDRRVFVITKDAIYDPGNFSDLRMIRFSLFFNREEYEMTLWRLTEGKYDGAAKGRWVAGSVPYGFRYNPVTQNLEANDSTAPVIRLIFNLYLQGYGFRSVSKQLSRLGIRSPRGKQQWRPEVIRRMIRNPAYKGTLVFRKTKRNKLDGRVTVRPSAEHIVVEEAFPGLIPEELWQQAQTRLKTHPNPVKIGPGAINQQRNKREDKARTSELSGCITCRQCQHTLIRQHNVQQYRQKSGKLSHYEKEFLYCPDCGYAVKYRSCERQLVEVLKRIPLETDLFHVQLTERIAELTAEDHQQQLGKTSHTGSRFGRYSLREGLRDRQRALESRRERAREFVLDGTFTKKEYRQVVEQIDAELEQLKEGLETIAPTPERSADCSAALDSHQNGSVSQTGCSMYQRLQDETAKADTLGDIYRLLSDKSLKNRLLGMVLNKVDLELVTRGKGRNRPSSFHLYVTLQPGWMCLV